MEALGDDFSMTYEESLALSQKQFDNQLELMREQQRSEQAWSAEQAQKQMDFQERMANTAHQREIEDLKKSGLNPVLAAGGQGAAAPSGASGGTSSMVEAIPALIQTLNTNAEAMYQASQNEALKLQQEKHDKEVSQLNDVIKRLQESSSTSAKTFGNHRNGYSSGSYGDNLDNWLDQIANGKFLKGTKFKIPGTSIYISAQDIAKIGKAFGLTSDMLSGDIGKIFNAVMPFGFGLGSNSSAKYVNNSEDYLKKEAISKLPNKVLDFLFGSKYKLMDWTRHNHTERYRESKKNEVRLNRANKKLSIYNNRDVGFIW